MNWLVKNRVLRGGFLHRSGVCLMIEAMKTSCIV